ncbi:hypothetical protein [Hyphomicrobium sp. DMF-1]|uniref:hypothetical protein n=1 Tax=Hyphomicrobium sp. DMF-1 TaxID=3019544 RepID=UPI0022EC0F05|nr:hypothetical protein [Hyphomicrobium sp. DMF-1]WBT40155.1 hypothetical protein PE058_09815 [Hyphomicrobium sp. DMF-1]
MNTSQLKSQIVPILHLVGLALVVVAALKFGGVRISFGGRREDLERPGVRKLVEMWKALEAREMAEA